MVYAPLPGDLMSSSDILGTAFMWCIDIHAAKFPAFVKFLKIKIKNSPLIHNSWAKETRSS